DDDRLVASELTHELVALTVEESLPIEHDPGGIEPRVRMKIGLTFVGGHDLHTQIQRLSFPEVLTGLPSYDHGRPNFGYRERSRGLDRSHNFLPYYIVARPARRRSIAVYGGYRGPSIRAAHRLTRSRSRVRGPAAAPGGMIRLSQARSSWLSSTSIAF